MSQTGRCAMTLRTSVYYIALQSPVLDATTGIAMMPGSQKVWWRDGHETVHCNRSFCRHATEYHDGVVVNHAPVGHSSVDMAISSQIGRSEQLAAFIFLTWPMSDAIMLEAVVNPPFWPNILSGTFEKPSLLVASAWSPCNWSDPVVSLFCATLTSCLEHPNVVPGLRLSITVEVMNTVRDIATAFWQSSGDIGNLDDEAGAVLCSTLLTTDIQRIIDREGRTSLIADQQMSLNIYVTEPTATEARGSEAFPAWALHAVVGILSGTVASTVSIFLWWLCSAAWRRRRLHAEQQEAWQGVALEAETYATSLRCNMALVSATKFFAFGRLGQFEATRDDGLQCPGYPGEVCGLSRGVHHCVPVPAVACLDQPRRPAPLWTRSPDLQP